MLLLLFCTLTPFRASSAIIFEEECDDPIVVGDWCVPGEPHFDPEGSVCANDGTPEEAYCSYDVGPSACARCGESPRMDPLLINGWFCSYHDVEIVEQPDVPCADAEEGTVCNAAGTGQEAYCASMGEESEDAVCAYCTSNEFNELMTGTFEFEIMGRPHKLYICEAEDDESEPVALYWSVTDVMHNEYTIGL